MDRQETPPGPVVDGFADGGFSVAGRVYRAVLLTPEAALEWRWEEGRPLAAADLAPALALSPPPEFLVLGTGPRLVQPPRPLVRELEARGIGVEAMDSRAAARTWGLLRGEERWIAAALMPLG
ncbi:MAG: Mth938-like domain-containing protein [Alphaproteobacteria bacterium]|nr:Mth938-like domain-containing protein [Alphaproteobacteria bacterium]MBV9371160.1 Mth938-like domain-containing protein [Alphaproteobacteria bacterium]MBV9901195.1 Mth938-like domain-containing protein [Alphaproteobacteria bacterium]